MYKPEPLSAIFSEQPLLDGLPVSVLIIDKQGFIHYHNPFSDKTLDFKTTNFSTITQLSRNFKKQDFEQAINELKENQAQFVSKLIILDQSKNNKPQQLKIVLYPEDQRFYLVTLSEEPSAIDENKEPSAVLEKKEPSAVLEKKKPSAILENKETEEQTKYTLLKKNFRELKNFSRLDAMREISTSLADQLNQPLTAILSYTQAMQRLYQNNASADEIINAMERVVINAKNAGNIIRNLRSQLDVNTLNVQKTCINQIIKECIHLTDLDNPGSQIKLTTHFDQLNTSLSIDPIQFKQVILNLLNNAIDAIIEASISSPEIILSTARQNSQYIITIEDNGNGIPEKVQEQLFEPFVTTKKNGIGIGLSMCHHIIDLHKGKISIISGHTEHKISEKQPGTVVTIYLPVLPNDLAMSPLN